MYDPNDPRPMELQAPYDPRPEEQKPNYGYDPTPKVPEPHELPRVPAPAPWPMQPQRREIVVPVPSGGGVFALGVILLLAFMVITPIHASALGSYQEELARAANVDWSGWDPMDPSTIPEAGDAPEPSWFVKHGARMKFYLQWVGVLLLFVGLYIAMPRTVVD